MNGVGRGAVGGGGGEGIRNLIRGRKEGLRGTLGAIASFRSNRGQQGNWRGGGKEGNAGRGEEEQCEELGRREMRRGGNEAKCEERSRETNEKSGERVEVRGGGGRRE
eukprot:266531-Chlamydomonas_euryale.AAC.1